MAECCNRQVTAYFIILEYEGGALQGPAFKGNQIYMSVLKEHVEEEAARLKAAGEDPHLYEIQGPPGLNLDEIRREMTKSFQSQVLKSRGK